MDKHYHHLHIARHLHFRIWLHDKYTDLVIADTLRHLALAMMSLFIPIFLLGLGFTIREIAVLELVMCAACIGMHYLAIGLIPSWGVKKTLVISYFLNIVLYLLLYQAASLLGHFDRNIYLMVIAIFNVSASTVYWTGHHVYFFKTSTAADSGRKVGLLMGVPALAGIISPLLGGILISEFGFKTMFLMSTGLLLAAGIALMFSENIMVEKSSLEIKRILDFGQMRKNLIFLVEGVGLHAVAFFWPLLLFLLAVKLVSIGLLYLFSNLAYSVIGYYSGRRTDRSGNRKMVVVGSLGFGSSIILRSLATTVAAMTLWQTAGGTFGSLLHIPLATGFYKFSSRIDYYNAIMNREFYMFLGRGGLVIFFLAILTRAGAINALIITLIAAGVCTFALGLIARSDKSIIS